MGHPSAIHIRYRRIQSELLAMRLVISYGDWRWPYLHLLSAEHPHTLYLQVVGFTGTV